MIEKIFESFSCGIMYLSEPPIDATIVNSMSIGLQDKRIPKGSTMIVNSLSIGVDEDVNYEAPKFIRIK